MSIITIFLLIIHITCCIGLILVVLLQAGKGASLGAAFGGGASQTVFGTGSATFVGKITWVMAGAFMVTSLLLTIFTPGGTTGERPEAAVQHEEHTVTPPLGTTTEPEASPLTDQDFATTVGGELTPIAPPESPAHSEPEPWEQP